MSRSVHSSVIIHKMRIVYRYKPQKTHAKEKLSTFCTDATEVPLIVIFVKGVLCSVFLPYQSMASTAAWPPSQLQLISASPACRMGSALESEMSRWFITQISIFSLESASADNWGSKVLASLKYESIISAQSLCGFVPHVCSLWENQYISESRYDIVRLLTNFSEEFIRSISTFLISTIGTNLL